MSADTSDLFIKALRRCEDHKDSAGLIELFSDDAQISSISLQKPYHGREGARIFWQEYRASFKDIHSHFSLVTTYNTDTGSQLVLEWASEGILTSGQPVHYQGVSLIEFREGLITRFRAYYDSAALARSLGERLPHERSAAA